MIHFTLYSICDEECLELVSSLDENSLGNIVLKETRNSYFCVTPKNQVLHECALLFFR